MQRLLVKDRKTGKKKLVNIPSYNDVLFAYDISISSPSGDNDTTISTPTFYNSDSGNYYTISVRGQSGGEYLQLNYNTSFPSSPFAMYDADSNQYYSIIISGIMGSEIINIVPSALTTNTIVQLLNSDNNAIYILGVSGTSGNEYLTITPLPS